MPLPFSFCRTSEPILAAIKAFTHTIHSNTLQSANLTVLTFLKKLGTYEVIIQYVSIPLGIKINKFFGWIRRSKAFMKL